MTAAMVEHQQDPEGRQWDYLLRTWQELDVPEGWRAEIDEGQIVLVPPPHAHHNGIAAKVQRCLYGNLPDELEIYQTLGVHVAPSDKLYVPDLVVMPSELIDAADPDVSAPMDASEALLVVEITSKGNAREDRTKKYRAYARAGVPMYLLIDRFDTRGPWPPCSRSRASTARTSTPTRCRSESRSCCPRPSMSRCPPRASRSDTYDKAAAPCRREPPLRSRSRTGQTDAGAFAVAVAAAGAGAGVAVGAASSWATLNSARSSLLKPKKYVATKPAR